VSFLLVRNLYEPLFGKEGLGEILSPSIPLCQRGKIKGEILCEFVDPTNEVTKKF